MRQHGPDRLAGQTGGVDHHSRISAFYLRHLQREGACRHGAPEGRGSGILFIMEEQKGAKREVVPDLGQFLGIQGGRDQAPGLAVAEQMPEFVGRREDIQRHRHSADFLDGEIGNDKFDAVGKHQGNLVAFLQPRVPHPVAEGINGPVQVSIGKAAFLLKERQVSRPLPAAFFQHVS